MFRATVERLLESAQLAPTGPFSAGPRFVGFGRRTPLSSREDEKSMSLQTVNVSEPEFLNGFLTDPPTLFEHSYTAVQTMPRERMLEAQIAGLVRRFEHQVEAIPMLAKLAGRQGIDSLDDLNDIV